MKKSGILRRMFRESLGEIRAQVLERLPRYGEKIRRFPLTPGLNRPFIGIVGAVAALGMATAIAVVPGEQAPTQTVIEQLEGIGATPIALGNPVFLREERVRRTDTVAALLSRLGVQSPGALAFLRKHPDARVIYQQLAPGKVVSARTTADGELLTLHFPLNKKDSVLAVEARRDGFSVEEIALRPETQVVMKAAEIKSSLFAAADGIDMPDGIAIQLAEIFSAEIDFHRDLRRGDRFSVVYEMQYLRGQPYRSGRILSAEFINDGQRHRALWFDDNGTAAYYTADGKNLRRAFLRSPLEFSRLTSGFAMRVHPIHGDLRAHKGVDYGAPSGTRVRATGDGTIAFAGWQNGYGNLLVVKHASHYSTAYGHLRGFAAGIKKGARVHQGDTIGYVGQTGWATGPHLHYEFRINNQQVNPLAANLPIAIPLEPAQLQRFKSAAAPQTEKLDLLGAMTLAAFE